MWGKLIASGLKAVFFGSSTSGETGRTNIEKAASFAATYLDESKYTDEERAKSNQKQIENINAFVAQTVSENSSRSITRREFALLVLRLAVAQTIFSIAVWKYDSEWAAYSFEWFQAWWPLIGGAGLFFFGTHLARTFTDKEKPK